MKDNRDRHPSRHSDDDEEDYRRPSRRRSDEDEDEAHGRRPRKRKETKGWGLTILILALSLVLVITAVGVGVFVYNRLPAASGSLGSSGSSDKPDKDKPDKNAEAWKKALGSYQYHGTGKTRSFSEARLTKPVGKVAVIYAHSDVLHPLHWRVPADKRAATPKEVELVLFVSASARTYAYEFGHSYTLHLHSVGMLDPRSNECHPGQMNVYARPSPPKAIAQSGTSPQPDEETLKYII